MIYLLLFLRKPVISDVSHLSVLAVPLGIFHWLFVVLSEHVVHLSVDLLVWLTYLIVLFVLFPFMIISGFAQMPAFTAISPELIDLFGGRQTARTLHVVCSLLLVLFVVVHLVQMVVAGALNQLRGMIIGKYKITQESNEVAQ